MLKASKVKLRTAALAMPTADKSHRRCILYMVRRCSERDEGTRPQTVQPLGTRKADKRTDVRRTLQGLLRLLLVNIESECSEHEMMMGKGEGQD